MPNTVYQPLTATMVPANDLAMASFTREPLRPMQISPIIHPRHGLADPKSRTFWSAKVNALYIVRAKGSDLFGEAPDWSDRLAHGNDVVEHGRRGPIGCDKDPVRGMAIWDAADLAATTDRPSVAVAHHLIGWFPLDADPATWREMALTFIDDQLVRQGMITDWAIHALPDGQGGWLKKPHLHAIACSRFFKGSRAGQPNEPWLITAASRSKAISAWRKITGEYE